MKLLHAQKKLDRDFLINWYKSHHRHHFEIQSLFYYVRWSNEALTPNKIKRVSKTSLIGFIANAAFYGGKCKRVFLI